MRASWSVRRFKRPSESQQTRHFNRDPIPFHISKTAQAKQLDGTLNPQFVLKGLYILDSDASAWAVKPVTRWRSQHGKRASAGSWKPALVGFICHKHERPCWWPSLVGAFGDCQPRATRKSINYLKAPEKAVAGRCYNVYCAVMKTKSIMDCCSSPLPCVQAAVRNN